MDLLSCCFSGLYTCISSNVAGTDTAQMKVTVKDVDECENGMNRCKQLCYNTYGSYKCGCYRGYKLLDDQVSCQGNDFCELETSMNLPKPFFFLLLLCYILTRLKIDELRKHILVAQSLGTEQPILIAIKNGGDTILNFEFSSQQMSYEKIYFLSLQKVKRFCCVFRCE